MVRFTELQYCSAIATVEGSAGLMDLGVRCAMYYVETHVFYRDADGIKSESIQQHPVDPALSSGKNAFDHWRMILEIAKRQGRIDSGTVMLKNEYDDIKACWGLNIGTMLEAKS